jgi:predicted nucleic acid-binding protein
VIVLDSDVLVDLARKDPPTVEFLERIWETGEPLATTSINVGEILRGARGDPDRRSTTVDVLEGLHEIVYGPRAAKRFGRITPQLDERGEPFPVVDAMIAAATLEEGARLCTRNLRDYPASAGPGGRAAGVARH